MKIYINWWWLLIFPVCLIAFAIILSNEADRRDAKLGRVDSIDVIDLKGDTIMIKEIGGTLRMYKY